MHELSLVQSLLDVVEAYRRRERHGRVNTLKLSFGHLEGIDAQALAFAFDVQSRGTAAEGARLEFDIRPALFYCTRCNRESPSEAFPSLCPRCGSGEIVLSGGTEELRLLEIDVEEGT